MAKVQAFVADGSLVSINQCRVVDGAVGRSLDWKEVEGSRQDAGRFYQACYEAEVSSLEKLAAEQAIAQYQEKVNDYR